MRRCPTSSAVILTIRSHESAGTRSDYATFAGHARTDIARDDLLICHRDPDRGIHRHVVRNSAFDLIRTTAALLGVSIPNFFLRFLLIFIFSLKLRWLPPIGYTPIEKDFVANLRGLTSCFPLRSAYR